MIVTLLVDNPKSWIIPFIKRLKSKLDKKHSVYYVTDYRRIKKGDLAFFLACEKMVPPEILKLNYHNLVVHESYLPKGKGMSPLTWQILEGKNKIPITLFEAAEKVDSGSIYIQDLMKFEGHELIDELHKVQGDMTIKMVVNFIDGCSSLKGRRQEGKSTFYRRRNREDGRLDINKSIREQFNLMRVADNEQYPITFDYLGHKYILKIYKSKEMGK